MPCSLDPDLQRQLPLIAKIIQDETWLEGERRGGPVSSHDPTVLANVCAVVLRIGADLRDQINNQVAAANTSGPLIQLNRQAA